MACFSSLFISLGTPPRTTALTRTPRATPSTASVRDSCTTPAFEAL